MRRQAPAHVKKIKIVIYQMKARRSINFEKVATVKKNDAHKKNVEERYDMFKKAKLDIFTGAFFSFILWLCW